MTTTTAETRVSEAACPPSSVVDMIVPWEDVLEGDLMLWDGELRPIERIAPYGQRDQGVWAVEFADIPGEVCIPAGTYAGVRRYITEGEAVAPGRPDGARSADALRSLAVAAAGSVHIGDVDPADGHLYPGDRERIADAVMAALGMGEAEDA